MTKHIFAAANTPDGFIDYFSNIMPLEMAKERYFLKGSSGSGKSTFIKKVASMFESQGETTERFHCSNDPKSLDALTVPDRGFCIIDATMPHSCDPVIPIGVDKIIDFAQFIKPQKIKKYVDELKFLLQTKTDLNKKISQCLKATGEIYLSETEFFDAPKAQCGGNAAGAEAGFARCSEGAWGRSPHCSIEEWAERLGLESFKNSPIPASNEMPSSACEFLPRKLFLSAVTPSGFVSYAEGYFKNEPHPIAHSLLVEIKSIAMSAGVKTEIFYNPFAPQYIDHLHLPEFNAAFSAEKKHAESDIFKNSLAATIDAMNVSKSCHNKIEEIYAATINFDAINKFTDKFITMGATPPSPLATADKVRFRSGRCAFVPRFARRKNG